MRDKERNKCERERQKEGGMQEKSTGWLMIVKERNDYKLRKLKKEKKEI